MPSDYERQLWRESARRWRAENPDRAREIVQEYYQRNAERIRQHKREYRAARKAILQATQAEPSGTP